MWYDVSMTRSRFNFKVKFDANREVFVLTVEPEVTSLDGRGVAAKTYEAHAICMSPNLFIVRIPDNEIPSDFVAVAVGDNNLPRGVQLIELRFVGSKVCFTFQLSNEALLHATPTVYRGWIQGLLQAGISIDAFARE
jgi:hypothetical protein